MIVRSFTGSIRKSAYVREWSCSWDAVIGQGNKVYKGIGHKQKQKFQVKGEKKGSFHVAQMHAVCLYMSIRKTIWPPNLQIQASHRASGTSMSWNCSPKKWFLVLGHNMWPQAHFWKRSRGRKGLTAMKPNELVSGKLQSGASSQDIRE